jgi:anti-sigma regulatory factor (Ser/Thr protein kinase)
MADALRLEARLDNLEALLDFVAARAKALDVPPELAGRVRLVLEELLVNVCNYAYAGSGARGSAEPDSPGLVEVRCLRRAGEQATDLFCVRIRDWGSPFDPLTREAPDTGAGLDERPVGGLGILLAVEMADHLDYCREPDANVLMACFIMDPTANHP